ncbi:MAG: sce7726 family protein [Rhizobiaceae bacterium]|nr:sce7726 family protein [Rhizobiaceae bacterium]
MPQTTSQVSAVARLFSSSVMRELSRNGRSPLFARLGREVSPLVERLAPENVAEFFDAAFDALKRSDFRHEYIYKAALTHKVLLGTHSLHTASMIHEFRVGECKADVAILNGTSTVYEIKSERDSLSRLERQIEAYCRFFAKVYVIAGENHIDGVRSQVSEDVGVLKLSSRHRISTVREARELPERTCSVTIFESIRTSEAKAILDLLDMDAPNVPNTEMHAALRDIYAKLPSALTHAAMVRVLKQSRNLLPLSDLVGSLPRSLQSAALSMPLRRGDHSRLLGAMNTPIRTALAWG